MKSNSDIQKTPATEEFVAKFPFHKIKKRCKMCKRRLWKNHDLNSETCKFCHGIPKEAPKNEIKVEIRNQNVQP